MDTMGCSEAKASELLAAHGWDLERAADAFLQHSAGSMSGTFSAAASAPAGVQATEAYSSRRDQEQHRQQQQQQQQTWLQTKEEQQQAGRSILEQLQPPRDQPPQRPSQQQASQHQAQRQWQPPPDNPMQTPPPRVPAGWKAVWSQEQEAYYFWHLATNDTTWEPPEVIEHAATPPLQEFVAATEAPDLQPAQPASSAKHYTCLQHWRPRADLQVCLRLLHGERLEVTWNDGQIGGWAFGYTLEDPSKEGYFPQDIFQPAKRPGCPRHIGDHCHATEHFVAPEEVAGYVSVEQGDAVRVLHPSQDPFAWVYVERTGALQERGWLPDAVLAATGGALGEGLGISNGVIS